MHAIHHQYADVSRQQLFYREAGPAGVPTVVLLHGFPASSFMFRDLIPVLADRYHVIAPDHLGFGLSGAPPAGEFTYTWYHDFVLVYRPGSGAVQLRLFADYASNLPLYPKLHAWLGDSGVPVLAVWGRNDEIFRSEGAGVRAGCARCHPLGGRGLFLLESAPTPSRATSAASSEGCCRGRSARRPACAGGAGWRDRPRGDRRRPRRRSKSHRRWPAQGKADYFADMSGRNRCAASAPPTTLPTASCSP